MIRKNGVDFRSDGVLVWRGQVLLRGGTFCEHESYGVYAMGGAKVIVDDKPLTMCAEGDS